jgi:GT2 family glycosyltransferase
MEKQNPKTELDVSIIIINFGSTEFLKSCLESFKKFTSGINYELIIIDNDSKSDKIVELLKSYPQTVLIRNYTNKGFGAANNQGLKVARGKYVLFLNNDTIFIENAIKDVYDFAQKKKFPVIVGCKILNPDKTLQKSVYDFPSVWNVFTSNFFIYALFPKSKHFNKYHLMNKQINEITEVDVVTGAFLLIERSAAMVLQGFDERFFLYNEETDLCYRFKKKENKIYYYPLTSIIHMKGGTSNKNMKSRYRNESISTIQFYQKHFSGVKCFTAISFHYLGKLIRIPFFFIASIVTFDIKLLLRSYYSMLDLFTYPINQFKN